MKASQTPPLPARRAFVVQFRAEADVEQGRFVGRVEHVVSGQAAPFHSLQQLEAFFSQVLTRPSAACASAAPHGGGQAGTGELSEEP